VDVSYDGVLGLNLAQSNTYDAIILDINLPQMNGYDVCMKIREMDQDTPILMLTALRLTENKLKGFDCGADDYIGKPFEFKELIARLKVFMKRTESSKVKGGNILSIADLILDTDSKRAWREKTEIILTAKEFKLLEYLLKCKNRVISRSELSEKIWDINFNTGTNIVDVYINYLRNKINKDGLPKLIHTVTGMGYVIRDL
jgi:two-component system, OmpR family, copper resistance phosphate regulon response regulator CusR